MNQLVKISDNETPTFCSQISSHSNTKLTLLCNKQSISPLQGNAVSRVFIIWGETRWVGGLGDFARDDLFEGVDADAFRVEGVHKMHFDYFH